MGHMRHVIELLNVQHWHRVLLCSRRRRHRRVVYCPDIMFRSAKQLIHTRVVTYNTVSVSFWLVNALATLSLSRTVEWRDILYRM